MNGAIGAGLAAVVVLAAAIFFVLVSGDDDGDSGDGDVQAGGTSTTAEVLEPEEDPDYDPEDEDPPPEGEMVHLSDLAVGLCFHEPDQADSVTELESVDCEVRHDWEVYYIGDLEDGPWRGDEQVGEDADALCADPFEDYVGLTVGDSELEVNHLVPTSGSWQGADDRQVVCVVGEEGGRTTGSLEGADR